MEWANNMNKDHLNSLPAPASPPPWSIRPYTLFGFGRRDAPLKGLPTSQSSPASPDTEASRQSGLPPSRRTEYVLLCIKAAGTQLFHANITDKPTDEEMFRELHERYQETRAWYKKLISLKKLQRIEFVRVGLAAADA